MLLIETHESLPGNEKYQELKIFDETDHRICDHGDACRKVHRIVHAWKTMSTRNSINCCSRAKSPTRFAYTIGTIRRRHARTRIACHAAIRSKKNFMHVIGLDEEIKLKEAFNAQAAAFQNDGMIRKERLAQQRRLAQAFSDFIGNEDAAILDVHPASSAVSEMPLVTLQSLWPERRGTISSHAISVHRADKEALPFRDGEFDWVFCNATLEHLSTLERQQALLSEVWRISRKGIFVTAPNRRHPIEFNTGLPALHWLPPALWKKALAVFGKGEAVASLFSAASLEERARHLPAAATCDIGHVRMMGIKAQFFLMMKKRSIP